MRLGRTAELICAGVLALGGVSYVLIAPGEARTEWASTSDMIRSQFQSQGEVRPLTPSAARVALSAMALSSGANGQDAMAALTATHRTQIDLGSAGTLEVAVLDDDTADPAFELFSPEGDPYSPVVLNRGERDAVLAVNYERRFETPGHDGQLDVTITPRAGISVGPDGSAAGAGAEVRLGQYLADAPIDRPRWYMFAGADRRALLYDPREGVDFDSAMYLTQREVIGDAQAGLAMRLGSADLSVAYVRREYRHIAGMKAFDETEEFGAVTVNWRW